MSTINKICLFAGSFIPEGWARCDGKNGTPNMPPIVYNIQQGITIHYICCMEDTSISDEFLIGQIIPLVGMRIPDGWALCDGSIKSTDDYLTLHLVVGNKYGGDRMTNKFALPKLTNISNEGEKKEAIRYIICLKGMYPIQA